ncbi:reverse transcriptase, partial [Lasius niger]
MRAMEPIHKDQGDTADGQLFEIPIVTEILQPEGTPEEPNTAETAIIQDKGSSKIKEVISVGKLSYFVDNWKNITRDNFIIQTIRGYKIPFLSIPNESQFRQLDSRSTSDIDLLEKEVESLQKSGAIKKCSSTKGQFVSQIFLVDKPGGTKRFIINLKRLNEFVDTPHFKLEDLRVAANLLTSNDFMSHVDLKDAYFAIPIHKNNRKYFRFDLKGVLYEFTCLPFGLSSSPFVFTKIMRPVVNYIRKR